MSFLYGPSLPCKQQFQWKHTACTNKRHYDILDQLAFAEAMNSGFQPCLPHAPFLSYIRMVFSLSKIGQTNGYKLNNMHCYAMRHHVLHNERVCHIKWVTCTYALNGFRILAWLNNDCNDILSKQSEAVNLRYCFPWISQFRHSPVLGTTDLHSEQICHSVVYDILWPEVNTVCLNKNTETTYSSMTKVYHTQTVLSVIVCSFRVSEEQLA